MPKTKHGEVNFRTGVVTLNSSLDQAGRRSAICHELIHIERGPVSTDRRLRRLEERDVRDEASRRLIDIPRLVSALQWSRWPGEVAEECWVDLPTLHARIAHLSREERSQIEAAVSHPSQV